MKKAVICFTRVPRPGHTKTRLLPILRGEQCAALHTAFLQDMAAIYNSMDADLLVACAPDPDIQILREIFPLAKDIFPQEGNDLGERMLHAIAYTLNLGYDAVILTGSDLPLLTAAHLNAGFAALQSADIAIGPTSDGGYYLIGMKQAHAAPFFNQSYGGSSVYHSTIRAIEQAGLTAAAAPLCDDVDTPDDLKLLAESIHPGSFTGKYIHQLRKEGIPI